MLTSKQKKALMSISDYVDRNGVAPSYAELQEELGLKSKTSIFHLVNALESRGYIRRLKYRARALEIIRMPPDAVSTNRSLYGHSVEECVQLDLMGTISAGSPIEAIQEIKDTMLVPATLLSGIGEHFALEVKGNSMIGAGINDGDIIIIRRQNIAEFGDIVVAFVKGETATLKRIRQNGDMIRLEAANPDVPDQSYVRTDLEIQGKLVGLYRTY